MAELAVVMLAVDSEPQASNQNGPFPIICYDPDLGAGWQEVQVQLAETGVLRVLLQFSNESVEVPPHYWNHLDLRHRRYSRLYSAEEILSSISPISCIELYPGLPLPDLTIRTRPVHEEEQGWRNSRLLLYFHTKAWDRLELVLNESSTTSAELFMLSCFYARTNRFEEAYATSLKALSQDEAKHAAEKEHNREPESFLCDPADLWLAHALHAVSCGRHEEAVTAFKMSYAERPRMEPLYFWADELIRLGSTDEEAVAPIEQWLDHFPHHEEGLIRLLYRVGMYGKALEKLERWESTDDSFIRLRFDCLIRVGRIAEAVLFFREQTDDYRNGHSTDRQLCELILADTNTDNNIDNVLSPLTSFELTLLLERLVALRFFHYAAKLQPYLGSPLPIAHVLFQNGYVMRAAAYFLQAMKDNAINPEGMRCLGEILYYRGAYEQSASMFEYLLSQAPQDTSLRAALALACLRQSEALLNESMHIFPSSVFLREESEKVASGIKRMEQSEVITRWRWSERKNFHE